MQKRTIIFLDPENMGKGTKIDLLSQILRKLWGIEYLAHSTQPAISFFAYMTEKLPKGVRKHFSDLRSFDMSSK